MIHFVPAWYDAPRPWYSTDAAWSRTAAAEADDTVTRVRVFRQGDESTRLLVLNYAPNLRRYLHSQHIFDVPYWSFFDELQGIGDDYTSPIDFLELEWPEDVSFFYNPFLVTAMRGSEVYARVHLGPSGTLQSVRYYGDGMPTVERIYDDRGFVSSVLMHDEAGAPMTQYYLSREGDVVVSEDIPSGRIDVVQDLDGRLSSPSYDGWEPLITQFLRAELGTHAGREDTVVVATAAQHDRIVLDSLSEQTLVLSCASRRSAAVSTELLRRADAVFADFGQPGDDDRERGDEWARLPTLSIYPLERRPTFGASANEAEVCIAVLADTISPEQLDFAIATMALHLVDERTRLLVCTARPQDLDHLQAINRVIAGYQHLDTAFWDADDPARLGADVGIADGPEEKIQLTFIEREADLIRTMARARVLVDLGESVGSRTAAAAVDAGVPQINRVASPLVTHPLNGYVIGDDGELAAALDHFLVGLENWNRSLVQCRVLEDLFAPEEVLGRWALIREGVALASAADRP